jgi:tripartite-type tricarboxylate transporter receptor subunit TctC
MRLIARTLALLAVTLCAPALAADPFPTRPITIVVPYQAGGTNDIVARAITPILTTALGQPVIVENRPGASGIIGASFVARAAPDGHTVLAAPVSLLSINPWLYPTMPKPDVAFAPITIAGSVPNILVVHPSVPAASVKELLQLARTKPGSLNFASMGAGTTGHLNGELFKTMTRVDMTHVAYKGSAPAVTDLLAGHVQLMFDNLPTALPHVKSGKLRALALTSAQRHPMAPDVPTMAEAGVPGFEATAWFGFVAPAATPKPIVERLAAEMAKALRSPDVASRLNSLGMSIIANTPAEFSAYIKAETDKWGQVVAAANVKVQ